MRTERSAAAVAFVVALGSSMASASAAERKAEPAPAAETTARGPGWWREAPPDDLRRFSVAGQFETQVVGLAFGARGEVLYRPFRFDRGANLRLGVGVQGGPEHAYLPVDMGWRQHFVPHRILTLELGAGYEQQTFFVPGLAPISRPAFYAEGGFALRVVPGGWLGAQLVPSWAPFSRPGPGLAVRLGFRWTLGARQGKR